MHRMWSDRTVPAPNVATSRSRAASGGREGALIRSERLCTAGVDDSSQGSASLIVRVYRQFAVAPVRQKTIASVCGLRFGGSGLGSLGLSCIGF